MLIVKAPMLGRRILLAELQERGVRWGWQWSWELVFRFGSGVEYQDTPCAFNLGADGPN